MVTPSRQIIKKILNEIKKEEKNKYNYNIELNFDPIVFYKYNRTVESFWRVLTSTFTTSKKYKKPNNKWFKEINPEGFFFFTESFNLIQFRIYLESKIKIDIDDLKIRVEQIAPILQLNYSINNEFEFNKMFANDIFTIQKSKIQYIGEVENYNLDDEEESIDLPF